MSNIRFTNVFTTFLVISLGGVILFYPRLGLNSQVQIKLIADGINSILKALSVKSSFTQSDVLNGLILTEYATLGVFLMMMVKSYTQDVLKNISVPLFIGLSLAVVSGYIGKYFGAGTASLDVVINEFIFLLLGIFMYLVSCRLLQNKFGRGNYSRRR